MVTRSPSMKNSNVWPVRQTARVKYPIGQWMGANLAEPMACVPPFATTNHWKSSTEETKAPFVLTERRMITWLFSLPLATRLIVGDR